MTNQDKCYSINEEEYCYDNLSDALVALEENDGFVAGAVIHEGDAHKEPPSHYFDIDRLFEDMGERACDECGEWAEDFPDVSKEKVKELEKLIADWLDANIAVNFYTVKNVQPIVITEEMIAEHHS